MAGYGETDGSMMDQGGRIKPLASAASPAGDALPGWEILCRVARAMGKPGFDYRSVEKIQSEMNEYLDAQPECGQPSLYVRPNWLTAPAQHDYMGADLARWVSGLGELADFGTVEVKHVEGA